MNTTTATHSVGSQQSYVSDYDAIVAAMERYNEGVRTGNSAVMRPSFHANCSFYGYFQGQLLAGPIQLLFDWVDGNGPAATMEVRYASIDVLDTIAVVRLEMEGVKGKLAGEHGSRISDLFQFIKVDGTWQISQKSFHWHVN